MANNQRTYEWVNGRIQHVEAPRHWRDIGGTGKPARPKTVQRKQGLGIQNALLLFTLSSVTLVFAGGVLVFVCVVLYSVLFG
ncbi:hypothetical protein P2T68_17185 [Pseudomonas sp. G11]|uniref:hypothetical protein n=1 Tax=Pseudomonas sp. G11 TaxID=528343 RepID=UPI0024029FB2|nr:hypothetical protein [Pseudomonas sp. G11]WEX18974.1 hypothetical protein P2T68_17185 [Pseudomonas sp. G11]